MTELLITIMLFMLIIFSIFYDITQKKIPNFITAPAIIWGLLSYTIFEGFAGLKFSGIGFFIGLAVFIVPFIFGVMGGGDVKLMAAIGALKGSEFVLYTTLYTALAGGVIVIILLIKKRMLLVTLKRVVAIILKPLFFVLTLTFKSNLLKKVNNWLLETQVDWEKEYIPYGVAIGIGAIATLLI